MNELEKANAELAAGKVAAAGGFMTFEQFDEAMRHESYVTPVNWVAGWGLSVAERKANHDKLCAAAALKLGLLVQVDFGYQIVGSEPTLHRWVPKDQPIRIGIDKGGPEGDSTAVWLRQGSEFICELQPGDSWTLSPQGGVIVCNPEHKPVWHRVVNGERVREVLEPSQWPDMPARSPGVVGGSPDAPIEPP